MVLDTVERPERFCTEYRYTWQTVTREHHLNQNIMNTMNTKNNMNSEHYEHYDQ